MITNPPDGPDDLVSGGRRSGTAEPTRARPRDRSAARREESAPVERRHDEPAADEARDDGAVDDEQTEADGADEPPRVLGERYLLEERIARGGMATVWRAHDEKLTRTVAVKLLERTLAGNAEFRERFRREAVNAAKLSHPGIVGVYDAGADGPWVYLVMEYVEGSTLAALLADGPLTVGEVARIGRDIGEALAAAADSDVVHRDVKPGNVLVDAGGRAKIADFGIAKAGDSGDLTRSGTVLGTAAYLAPEQIRGGPVDHRADQYGLGCVLYEALTGRRPFDGTSPVETARERLRTDPLDVRQLRADVPRDLAAAIMRALAREPDDRWPDHRSLVAALRPFVDDQRRPVDPDLEVGASGAGSHSFLRSEGRWLGLGLALLVIAIVATAVGLATGVIRADGIPRVGALEIPGDEAPGADVRALALDVADLSSYDPQGDGSESDDALAALIDGDADTVWSTEVYFNAAAFGGLKDGVGVLVDLGEPRAVSSVGLRAPVEGQTVEIRVPTEPTDDSPGALPPEAWTVVGSADALGTEERVAVDAPPTRFLLVWLTGELPGVGDGRFQGRLAELEIAVAPE